MFKHYKDLCDVVSLLLYCPNERCFLLNKETSGELWLPSVKCEKSCWNYTAQKIAIEIFGNDTGQQCSPFRVCKIWLPNHHLQAVYHAVYKTSITSDAKKKLKLKQGIRNKLQWFSTTELERQRAHTNLRSPELAVFASLVTGITNKELESQNMDHSTLIEICESNMLVCTDAAGGAVAMTSTKAQLLKAASYTQADQIRLYREFILMVYPCTYMSLHTFTQFMTDIGWDKMQCIPLFRSADTSGRGGLTFLELMLWIAASEPVTQHNGIPAEIRYFDSNRDMKLEYVEFKEIVAATRAARQLQVDTLSVARDAEVCYRQLGLQPNSQIPLGEFLRAVAEKTLRGTSSLLRAPKSVSEYLQDLQDRVDIVSTQSQAPTPSKLAGLIASGSRVTDTARASAGKKPLRAADYSVAVYTVRMRRTPPYDMIELTNFDEDAVSPSTACLIANMEKSIDQLGPKSLPVEALAAVHYFATPVHNAQRRLSLAKQPSSVMFSKPAFAWGTSDEEVAMGSLLLRLAEAVKPICAAEPRLLRLTSPCYVVGDLHGNLDALLTMESALWAGGSVVSAARLLFLGDFVDRGANGTELIAYLFAAKLQRPFAVHLIRGNHEIRDIQKMFTFHNECITKYGEVEGAKIWNAVNNVFDMLPLAAVVDEKVFCCHGGIPPPWVCPLISAIEKVPVPLTKPAEQSSVAWELLWNDPVKANKMTASLQLELAANEGFAANTRRGTGHVFNQIAIDRFLNANQLSHVVRAHEVQQNGFMCQLRGRVISVFSSYRYCGGTNDSGVALLEGGKLRLLRVNTD